VALALCYAWAGWAFVSPPKQTQPDARFLAPLAAGAAAASIPAGAWAVEPWVYKEQPTEFEINQWICVWVFFLAHCAGVADFYAKKFGGGPAVPINPFRTGQGNLGSALQYEGSFKFLKPDTRNKVDRQAVGRASGVNN